MRRTSALAAAALLAAAPTLAAPWLPSPPGAARCTAGPVAPALANDALRLEFRVAASRLALGSLDNRYQARATPLPGELFALALRDGRRLPASAFALDGAPYCHPLAADPGAARARLRRPGSALAARLVDAADGLVVGLEAELRDGANYVELRYTLESATGLDVAEVVLVDQPLADAAVVGTADGAPVATGSIFLGLEHPMSSALVAEGRATAKLRRALSLRAGVPVDYAAVLGVVPAGQLRRGFAAYLEDARAHPYRTFLHYNSWYDIGYFSRYSETEALGAIEAVGTQLARRRGVRIDSFLFDDGWDDPQTLWQFHGGFPQGFAPLARAAAVYGAAPGMWLSPWGGYGPPRRERIAAATAAGYETDAQGLALSGSRYYALFHERVLTLLRDGGVNQFKLDGVGSPDKVTPGSPFDSDFAAAMALIDDLRRVKPDLFVNLTTGTWPSPFWLLSADSIWRGGEDHLFAGEGSDRQRWVTYRDADTYGGIVRQSPLFPLNSLMLHGIIDARHARGLAGDPGGYLAAEAWSYFASGTGLEELYVSPELLGAADWDTLADAAKWARARAEVLLDSHWLGGDPARGEVYGWGAWAPGRGVVALRNPSARPRRYVLRLAADLELPARGRRFRARVAFGRAPPPTIAADVPLTVTLAPFEVLVWDLVDLVDRG
jgi:hypothetical protein